MVQLNSTAAFIVDCLKKPTSEEAIYQNFTELLDNQDAYNAMAHAANPYGDGHASERIADILEQF